MRGLATILAQALISALLTSALFPLLLLWSPAVRQRLGTGLVYGVAAVIFVLLRLVWPRPKRP